MVAILTISVSGKINVYNLISNKNCLVKPQNIIAPVESGKEIKKDVGQIYSM